MLWVWWVVDVPCCPLVKVCWPVLTVCWWRWWWALPGQPATSRHQPGPVTPRPRLVQHSYIVTTLYHIWKNHNHINTGSDLFSFFHFLSLTSVLYYFNPWWCSYRRDYIPCSIHLSQESYLWHAQISALSTTSSEAQRVITESVISEIIT